MKLQPGKRSQDCREFGAPNEVSPQTVFGLREGTMVADVRLYDRRQALLGRGLSGWRSGIKHDCSKVFELVRCGSEYTNGLGERVDVEGEVLFPLLKSSDVARNRLPRKWLLVPQRTMAASPADLQRFAPKAWKYLVANDLRLAQRGSSVYRNRAPFSIFGVGDYSFSPWKIAISGLYKKLEFRMVAPFHGRPVVLDDTCYILGCKSEEECRTLYELVQSEPAQEFLSAFIFWDAKRPIKAQILNLLDLAVLARAEGLASDVVRTLAERQLVRYADGAHQQLLFSEDTQEHARSHSDAGERYILEGLERRKHRTRPTASRARLNSNERR